MYLHRIYILFLTIGILFCFATNDCSERNDLNTQCRRGMAAPSTYSLFQPNRKLYVGPFDGLL